MSETEAMEMKGALESNGEVEFNVCTLGKAVKITKNMVNRIRELPQNNKIVATHTDSPDVLIWDVEAQPNRHAVLGTADSRPDLRLNLCFRSMKFFAISNRLISNSRSAGAHRPEDFLFNRQNPFQQTSSLSESAERVAQLEWFMECVLKMERQSMFHVIFRTDNGPYKVAMEGFTKKIVDMMKAEGLYESQGGPIIMSQVEIEYEPMEYELGAPG
ncbi:hypothetical protein MRB53_005116 [Persea americana]|uniref:Uncharacterized protein n=1 Tax=Persea americana TaxID=3435 RepID=A0ACC2MD50_PERAE|nr:hypothetical protein MRB53_005116 [Persea americana]